MTWKPFDEGATVGQCGTEDGVTILDEEHDLGSRITLERDCRHAPFGITCGIYGGMFHTRYLGSEAEAIADYERMKDGLVVILTSIPMQDDPNLDQKMERVREQINAFVESFP